MNIKQLIEQKMPLQYVYSYPTARSYAPIEKFQLGNVSFTKEIDVYIHIPFCNQKCSFCGYLTVIEKSITQRDLYVAALVQEIKNFQPFVQGKMVKTINFGGGTPSLLSNKQVSSIMEALHYTFPNFLQTATEVSMEATPESIAYEKLIHLKNLGFNRISIGVQSLEDTEISTVKRHNSSTISLQAMETIRESGIGNMCIDLMYGLPLQTRGSWAHTVERVLSYSPETIELYRTVIIPSTRLAKKQDPTIRSSWEQKYSMYSIATELINNAGYARDSHVRHIIPGKGFYEQQKNVFKGNSLVGFGVGARSYTADTHYRNVYASIHTKSAVEEYIYRIQHGTSPVTSSVCITIEEMTHRYIIYNLENLDCSYLMQMYGCNFLELYKERIAILMELGLAHIQHGIFSITESAMYHRDLIAYLFFSKSSIALEKSYYGNFLNEWE